MSGAARPPAGRRRRGAAPAVVYYLLSFGLPLADSAAQPKIRVVSIAELIGETLRRINNEESVSYLFVDR